MYIPRLLHDNQKRDEDHRNKSSREGSQDIMTHSLRLINFSVCEKQANLLLGWHSLWKIPLDILRQEAGRKVIWECKMNCVINRNKGCK